MTDGVEKVPIKIQNCSESFHMSYQHDLIIRSNDELRAIGSVKTSSKDRIDKMFVDKYLYNKLKGLDIPHFAVFLNDVQRKGIEGKYGINATFLSGHFIGYTINMSPLDGVYYCDIRPNMKDGFFKEHIKTIDNLFVNDIWNFIK